MHVWMGQQVFQSTDYVGHGKKPKIRVVCWILNHHAVFPTVERSLAETRELREGRPRHSILPANGEYFSGCQDTKMTAHCFVPEPLSLLVQKLEVACGAASNGEVDL